MELRDLYDKNFNLTGEVIQKSDPIPSERYILVVLIFIQNSKGEFLIQKRSESHNGKFGSTGGHAKHGETSIQAILNEVQEEIGLSLVPTDFELVHSGRNDHGQVFFDVYYMKKDIDIASLTLQKEEVDYVEWDSFDNILNLASQGLFLDSHLNELNRLFEIFKKRGIIKI